MTYVTSAAEIFHVVERSKLSTHGYEVIATEAIPAMAAVLTETCCTQEANSSRTLGTRDQVSVITQCRDKFVLRHRGIFGQAQLLGSLLRSDTFQPS